MTNLSTNTDTNGVDDEPLRDEIRTWLSENWDPDITLREWWQRLFDGRWSAPTWPTNCFGRGLSTQQARMFRDERLRIGAASGPGGLGVMLAAPTIRAHGTDAQKAKYLPGILTGQEAWCQLFSEPGAGSDLAAVQARASRHGNGWRVTGQKVWSSGAQHADYGMLLARTNPDVPKHQGISYFLMRMDQPGVDIRPIREMTGRAHFNEVFLDNVEVTEAELLDELDAGWAVANTTLRAERSGIGVGGDASSGLPAGRAGSLDRRVGDTVGWRPERSGTALALRGRIADDLIALARDRDCLTSDMRHRLVRLWGLEQIMRFNTIRITSSQKAGQADGPHPSLLKLLASIHVRLAREIGMSILGPDGMLVGPESATAGSIQELALFSPAPSIFGGTDQIQRNIIAERVLGLPKEPNMNVDVPFRELRTGTVVEHNG